MNKYKLLPCLLTLGLALGTGACSDDKLDEIDTNTNLPQEVPVNLLLSQAEAEAAFGLSGTDLAWFAAMFVEHTAGTHAQFQQADRRAQGSFGSSATSNNWSSIYAGLLQDLNIIIERASTGGAEEGKWRHVGIAKILKAYALGVATDLFGRIPNSEANKFPAIAKPKFDTQESVYQDIDRLLNDAILDLAKPTQEIPTNSDLYYKGDAAKWTKLAYTLKARYANHLSKRDPAGSAEKALKAAEKGFISSADNLTFSSYTTSSTGQNPWFQEQSDRNHFAVSNTFYRILQGGNTSTADDDPRIAALVGFNTRDNARNAAPNGAAAGDQEGIIYSRPAAALVSGAAPQPLVTYAELKFIEAEAYLRLNNRLKAYDAYRLAVDEDLRARLGTGAAAFLSSSTDATTLAFRNRVFRNVNTFSLTDVMTQKHIHLFIYGGLESYTDFRRTGLPELRNARNRVGSNPLALFPRRFPYPQSELDANGANVPSVGTSDGVWWDDGTED